MQGYVDDFAVFADALDATQIQELFAGVPPDQLSPPVPLRVSNFTFNRLTRQVMLTWNSTPGATYNVESSSDLAAWTPLATGYPQGGATGGQTTFTTTLAPSASGKVFLRVRKP
jgi:hypothetical protein